MNQEWYKWVLENRFPGWLGKALGRKKAKQAFLLQDHERCLWSDSSLEAMANIGISLLDKFPKCSQDLNPMETVWRELRARLAATEPTTMEDRETFIRRLRTSVAWLNRNRQDYLRKLCSCQKEWAQDVQQASPPGSRTKH